jgi:predicted  nucleic acid-binding Zn-ribbon protein
METRDFLELVKGILTKTPEARAKVDSMIDDLINDLDYEGQMKKYEEEMKEYERKMKEWEESQKSGVTTEKPSEIEQLQQKQKDFSDMSQSEIQELMDDAIDAGDFEKVKMLSQYLK